MSARIEITYPVIEDYDPGDYAILHGSDGGVGSAIDYDTALSGKLALRPKGAGILGFGLSPFGKHPFGRALAFGVPGFGRSPFGRHPFGYGCITLSAIHEGSSCGVYQFTFKAYDKIGNPHSGNAAETTVHVHIAPPAPSGLKPESYNTDTDTLVLEAA